MKKTLLVLTLAFILLSCDTDSMEDREEGQDQKYYTVTYHSEGHTEGEVPVDTYKYPTNPPKFDPNKIYRDDELPFERPVNGYTKVMGQGSMKKIIDGNEYRFIGWYWYPKKDLPSYDGKDEGRLYQIGETFAVRCNSNLYADWY